jgi:putative membrane-bound dehydrogenase-like protein
MVAIALLAGPAAQAVSPDEALTTFELHPAMQIELVAYEPLITDPVDMEFDEQGRAYALEMPGYPFPTEAGRVVLLTDTDGDGIFDKRTVFAENFPVADSLMPYRGGLLVASPPDIIFVKDTTGDGVADHREVLLGGFANKNTQHNIGGLQYGLDNWVHGGNGGNGGKPYWPETPNEKLSLGWNDFRIDFERKKFEITGRSSGGFELAIDDWGHTFGTHNTWHISQLVFPGHYVDGVPVGRGGTRTNVSDHEEGGLARIFPIGEQEARVNHPEQAGYFSAACGITYYGGGAFPTEFNGNIFIADALLNLIHRDVINPDGAATKASRGRERVAFLASTDRAFRPVNMTVGPDGALYVLDMHRDVIEHPEWIPDEIEVNLDLEAGKDKGRIYRITPKGDLPKAEAVFPRDDIATVVGRLDHPNQWWRLTAQRLLVEWQDQAAVESLEALLNTSTRPQARLHALWTLEGLGALTSEHIIAGLQDAHSGVRENAAQLAEPHAAKNRALRKALVATLGDDDAHVRLHATLAVGASGGVDNDATRDALLSVVDRDLQDEFTRKAIASTVGEDAGILLAHLLNNPDRATEGGLAMLDTAAQLVGRNGSNDDLGSALGAIADADDAVSAQLLGGIAEGIGDRNSDQPKVEVKNKLRKQVQATLESDSVSVATAGWRLAGALKLKFPEIQAQLLANAAEVATNNEADTESRVANLALYGYAPFETREETLFNLLDTRQPREVQLAAIGQMRRVDERSIAHRLLTMWDTLGPDVRAKAGDILLFNKNNHDILLTALENGDLAIGQLNLDLERRRRLLHWTDDENTKRRAQALFTDAGVVTRQEAIDKMRPALDLTGDPVNGKAVFMELCGTCHRIGDEGQTIAPNLTDIFRKSADTLLHDILDPNSAVDTQYVNYTIERQTDDVFDPDATLSGILVEETEDEVTLVQTGGAEHTIRREAIKSMTSSGLSMMPEELENNMEHQTMADLLAYLLQPR